jgi:hypothetical protein
VLLGATHGHTMKPDRMAMMLADDRAKDWGEADHRHFFFGHVHHESAREVAGVRVESFHRELAALRGRQFRGQFFGAGFDRHFVISGDEVDRSVLGGFFGFGGGGTRPSTKIAIDSLFRLAGVPKTNEAISAPVEGSFVAPNITAFAPTVAARSRIDL